MKRLFLFVLLAAAPVLAQNPLTAKFPGALAGDVDFGVACNSAHSTLTADINNSTLAIPVAAGAVFCSPAFVSIDYETMKVCSVTGNTLNVCAGGRAAHGSAASHSNGAAVDIWIDSNGFNQVAAELKAIETALGVSLANVASPWIASGGNIYYGNHIGIGAAPGAVNLYVRGETTANNVVQQWGVGGGSGGYAALSLYKTADVDGDFLFETYSAGGTADAPKIQFGTLGTPSLLVLDTVNWRVGVGTASPDTALHVVGNITISGASKWLVGENLDGAHANMWMVRNVYNGSQFGMYDTGNMALAMSSGNVLVGTSTDNSTGAKLQVAGTVTLSDSGGPSASNLFLDNSYGDASNTVESNLVLGGRSFGRRWGRIGGQQSTVGSYAFGQLNFYTYSSDVPHTSPDMTLDGYGDLHLYTGKLYAPNGIVGNLLENDAQSALNAPSAWATGVYAGRVYGGGYPTPYGNVLTIRGGPMNAMTQMYTAWPGTDAGPSGLWVRGARDGGTDVFGPWVQMVGNDGGTYGINITGNAGTAGGSTAMLGYGTTGSWDTDFMNTPAGQRRWTQLNSGVSAPATGWWFVENMRYADGGNYWGTQLAWGWFDRPGKVFARDINGGTFGGWRQIPTVTQMSGTDGLGWYIRNRDIGCGNWYDTSCDANGNGVLDRAEVADTWTGYRQGNFVFGGDPNVVVPNTTVNWVWRPHAYGSASLREVSCWTDAGTVVLDIKRSDGGSMLAAPLTCTTTGATQSSMDGPGYHFIGSPYGLGFTTSGVSGVHNLSVSFKYLTSMDGNPF